ncbi:helix-turn-helix domain-containing protein [Curtobacterium sp. SP.BCo]|uniref:helix-turn-helix domain-containing protein n=1 Tax=Curtobacterium sp. SP.BCo TaxID=3435229 RepID=UPI003F737E16
MRSNAVTVADVPADELARTEAAELVRTTGDRRIVGVTVELDDGMTTALPERLSTFLADLLDSMASGAGVSTTVLPDEMTTTVAADVIGVSRPTLMKLIRRGEIAARTVGTHHRLRREDVLLLRAARQQTRQDSARAVLEAGEAFD